jgi:hypothetical protein
MSSINNVQNEHVWPGGNPHAIRSHCQQREFSIDLCAVSEAPMLYRHQILTTVTTFAFEYTEVDCSKVPPSIRISPRGFNTAVLHHNTAVKCFNCCPKIIPDAGLVLDVKLQFPGLHAHLTSVLSISFCAGAVPSIQQRNCGVKFNSL